MEASAGFLDDEQAGMLLGSSDLDGLGWTGHTKQQQQLDTARKALCSHPCPVGEDFGPSLYMCRG